MKKTKPILFQTEMVQAILEGRKLQTRRAIKDDILQENKYPYDEEFVKLTVNPKYFAGDILWVRETFAKGVSKYVYKADNHELPLKWKPSIFMPKSACRLFLEITDVRIERLQDISEQDAVKEGIKPARMILNSQQYTDYMGEYRDYNNPINSFRSLWQSINGSDSWNKNPYVWVIDFKRVDKPENFEL